MKVFFFHQVTASWLGILYTWLDQPNPPFYLFIPYFIRFLAISLLFRYALSLSILPEWHQIVGKIWYAIWNSYNLSLWTKSLLCWISTGPLIPHQENEDHSFLKVYWWMLFFLSHWVRGVPLSRFLLLKQKDLTIYLFSPYQRSGYLLVEYWGRLSMYEFHHLYNSYCVWIL